MHGNVPYMFDYWADPVVHLLLLKSYMVKWICSRLHHVGGGQVVSVLAYNPEEPS